MQPAPENPPNPQQARENLLAALIDSNQWHRAKPIAQEIVAENPESPTSLALLGTILSRLNDYKNAITCFKKSLSHDPDSYLASYGLAEAYFHDFRFSEAKKEILTSLRLNPDYASTWTLKALIHLEFFEPQEAVECTKNVLRIDPNNSKALSIQAGAETKLSKDLRPPPENRIAKHQQSLAQNPDDPFTHIALSKIYRKELENYSAAEYHSRKALQISPDCTPAKFELSRTLRQNNLFLKFLWLPFLPCKILARMIGNISKMTNGNFTAKDTPFLLLGILGLILIKPMIIIILISFAIFAIFFWPISLIYEYLTISEMRKNMGAISKANGPMAKLHNLPLFLRFLIFALIVISLWTTVFATVAAKSSADFISFLYLAGTLFLIFLVPTWIVTIIIDKLRKKRKSLQSTTQNLYCPPPLQNLPLPQAPPPLPTHLLPPTIPSKEPSSSSEPPT